MSGILIQDFQTEGMSLGGFTLKIRRKRIKHIYFRIDPENKQINVSAPVQVKDSFLNNAILSKADWIKNKIEAVDARVKAPTALFISSNEIVIQGRPCHIKINWQPGRTKVTQSDSHCIILSIKPGSSESRQRDAVTVWLRNVLKQKIQSLVKKWEPVLNVDVAQFRVRRMKTRWGSCNIRARRIWLNQTLIHLEPCFLEYVVIHEMVHLLERHHNQRFKAYMDQFIPGWRQMKQQMNQISL